jgi:parallel beta-helix repeat protein
MRLHSTPAKISAKKALPWRLLQLEDRGLPSSAVMYPTHFVCPHVGSNGGVTPAGFGTPGEAGFSVAQIRHAYGFDSVGFGSLAGTGAGQTIAIVDAYDNPAFVSSSNPNFNNSDLHKFDVAMGIADPPSFVKIDENGGTNYPTSNAYWATEIALDVEWSHAMAPNANIVLIEAKTSSLYDIYTNTGNYAGPDNMGNAVVTARSYPNVSVVSMSFGGAEASADTVANLLFTTPSGHTPITFLASTGDTGAPGGYPAYSPNVVAVGGTSLSLSGSNYGSETGWSGSGGGISQFETKPDYQGSENLSSTKRTIPDVAFNAASGVAVYDSYNNGTVTPWSGVGGTSLSCPCWAGLIAVADEGRDHFGQGRLDGRNLTLYKLYGYSSGVTPALEFHDITTGNNGFAANAGYDLVTGWGSPYADRVIGEMIEDFTAPTVTGSFANVTTSGATKYAFNVTYNDNVAINPSTLLGSIHVSGPYGFSVNATLDSVTLAQGSSRVATFEFTPIGGSWDSTDDATYTISENYHTAADYHYNFVSTGTIGSFVCNITSNFWVTNSNNSGAGSLRQAVLDANAAGDNNGNNLIRFDSVYFQTPRTIMLTSEIPITVSVSIQGPGAGLLTVNGNGGSDIFNTKLATLSTIKMSGMTLTGGIAASGAAIQASNQDITLNGVMLTGNSATQNGGAISMIGIGSLTANDCTITNNFAANLGGAIEVDLIGGKIVLERCTVSGNTASGAGGIYVGTIFGGSNAGKSYLLVDSSTIANNAATSSAVNRRGGGLDSKAITGTTIVRNSTIFGNSAATDGGGLAVEGMFNKLTVQNSTIAANTASGVAGGGIFQGGSADVATLESTIVSGNSNASAADIYSVTSVAVNFSAIGDSAGFTFTGANNLAFGTDLKLGPLANNGGTMQTCAPAIDSPLINAGSNPAGLTFDQRGKGFPRLVTGAADIGAIETPLLVVTNTNDSGVGSLRQVLIDAQSTPTTANTITFDPTVFSVPQTITLSTGTVSINQSVTVSGPGANLLTIHGNNAGEVIYVNPPSGSPVTLSGMTITGGGGLNGVGVYENTGVLTLANCTITGNTSVALVGLACAGGVVSGGSLIVDSCTISGNSTTGPGGGIHSLSGNTIIRNSTIANNVSANNGGSNYGNGGGIYSLGNILVQNSTIANNSTSGSGGGILGFANILVENSTISGNSASVRGGGIYFYASSYLTARNTTITSNLAVGLGGGISAGTNGNVFVQNCTVVSNTAHGGPGGGICRISGTNPITLDSSIVAGNVMNIYNTPGDLGSSGTITANYCAIGVTSGVGNFVGDATTNSLLGSNFLLGTLSNNGGPTQTIALLAGSPCLDAGSNPATLTTDQRGTGFPRMVGSAVDIGAYEADAAAPTSSGSFPDVTILGGASYSLSVTYSDNAAISLASLATGNIRITRTSGPNNYVPFSVLATYVGTTATQNGTPIVADYIFNPPAGSWDTGDDGNYAVSVEPNQVTDTSGNAIAGAVIGSFAVNIPDSTPPTASASLSDVTVGGITATTYTFQVTYTDDVAVAESSFAANGNSNLRVIGPGGFDLMATYVSDNSGGQDTSSVTVTYSFAPPGGYWDVPANGAYEVLLQANQVSDTSGHFMAAASLGLFQVNIPDTTPPTASGSFNNVYGLGGMNYTLTVVYTDDVAVSYVSLQTGNILISGPGGSITATLVNTSPDADAASITATYQFTPPGGAWDAGNAGTYSVNLASAQVSDTAGNFAGASLLGSFIVDPQPLAQVQSVVINGGAAQRSRVTSIVVNFNEPVLYDTTVAGSDPFVLFKQGGAANVNLTVTPPVADLTTSTTSVTLTFTTGGPSVEFGSLADGRYTLQVGDLGSVTRSDGLTLDGDGDGQPGGTYTMTGDPATNTLFRLYGDINGDGTVSASDFIQFRQFFGGTNSDFDFDGDGSVSASDFIQFRLRFGGSI